DDSREHSSSRDNFPAQAPIAATGTQKLINQRCHEESADARTAEHEADGAAAVTFEPARRRGAAGNDVAKTHTNAVDDAESEKEFPWSRSSKRQKQRTDTDERRANQIRCANASLYD